MLASATAAVAPESFADSPDATVPATGSGTQNSPNIDVVIQAGVAGTAVALTIPAPQPVASANTISAALQQTVIGQAAQALGNIMPWNAFGIGCSLTPSDTRGAALQLRRERSASLP